LRDDVIVADEQGHELFDIVRKDLELLCKIWEKVRKAEARG